MSVAPFPSLRPRSGLRGWFPALAPELLLGAAMASLAAVGCGPTGLAGRNVGAADPAGGADTGVVAPEENVGVAPERERAPPPAIEHRVRGVRATAPAGWRLHAPESPGRDDPAALFTPALHGGTWVDVDQRPDVAFVALFPAGLGTEWPQGDTSPLAPALVRRLSFEPDLDRSRTLRLADGTAWAHAIFPAKPFPGWSDGGFVYGQVAVPDTRLRCVDANEATVPPRDCNPLMLDHRVRRSGTPLPASVVQVEGLLASLRRDG